MNKDFEKILSLIPKNENGDVKVPNDIKRTLSNLGTKGGQKYSNMVDKIVDSIFKKNK